MERKKALALASLSMVLLASFALITPTLSSPGTDEHKYWVMPINRKTPGNVVVRDSLNEAPPEEGIWNFTVPPLLSSQNITFSDPWTLPGKGSIVSLTVPHDSYAGISYLFYDKYNTIWFRFSTSMSRDGYGWIFLDDDKGDVDCHTFSNNSAAYWYSPSPKDGEKAADHGQLPSNGTDGVAGTGDPSDGFGDGTPDPRGSSILVLPITMTAEYHGGAGIGWKTLFTFSWPQVYTTGNATARVIEPDGGPGAKNASQIHGVSQTVKGQPWEFYAGLEYNPVPYGDPKWNAYVTYVCAWALLDISTTMGDYDNCFTIIEKKVRDDVLIADINCDEVCNIVDIVIAALAFDTETMNPGPDDIYYTADDKEVADFAFDARGDLRPKYGVVNIVDIVRIALDFDKRLDP